MMMQTKELFSPVQRDYPKWNRYPWIVWMGFTIYELRQNQPCLNPLFDRETQALVVYRWLVMSTMSDKLLLLKFKCTDS